MGASYSNPKPKGEPRIAKLSPDEAPPIERLSHDILRDILLRVPRSCHRMAAAVCLKWREIIRDPSFAAALERNYRPEIVITTRFGPFAIFAGVCNGLLCMQDKSNRVLMLVDPIKKEAVPLPQPKGPSYFYLGFDRETLKFKLLALTEYSPWSLNYFAQVLDQGKASWRKTRTHLPCPPDLKDAVIVGGMCYWIGLKNGRHYQPVISFDFSSEEFVIISPPGSGWCRSLYLTDLSGRLGFVDGTEEELTIWSLKDDKKSWVLEHRFIPEGYSRYTMVIMKIVGSRHAGEVVLLIRSCDDSKQTFWHDLITYDASTGMLKKNMRVLTQERKNCRDTAGFFVTESPCSVHSLWRPNVFPGAEKVLRLMGKLMGKRSAQCCCSMCEMAVPLCSVVEI